MGPWRQGWVARNWRSHPHFIPHAGLNSREQAARREAQVHPAPAFLSLTHAIHFSHPSLLTPSSSQAVYKTYIDVVHIQKDEASSLFSMFAADSQSQEVEETASQGERNIADAPATQASQRFERTICVCGCT